MDCKVECLKCKVKVELKGVDVHVYTTARGIKYGVKGLCPVCGHKIHGFIKKPEVN